MQRLRADEVQLWAAYLPDGLRPAHVSPAMPQAPRGSCSTPAAAAKAVAAASARRPAPHREKGKAVAAASTLRPAPHCEEGKALELVGRVWELSQEAAGCRQVQRALDAAGTDELRGALAQELRGHAVEAAHHPHANHVLQKVIVLSPSTSVQFVIDELQGAISSIAQNKYGCRIVQRLMEFCPVDRVQELYAELLEDVAQLCISPYGNYVVQAMLHHCDDGVRGAFLDVLRENLRTIAFVGEGCAVMSAALLHGGVEHRRALAEMLLAEEGLLSFLAAARHGPLATLRALELLEGERQSQAVRMLRAEAPTLSRCHRGREVLKEVELLSSRLGCSMATSARVGGG